MKQRYLFFLFLLSFFPFSPLLAQDTLSFGGIYDLPGAEVRATYTPVSPLAQSFTIEEVYRLPGTFYDPARLVALLPGVVQTNDQANHLSVRGNTPNANLWRLNGLAIVNPNHTANAGTFYDFPTLNGGGVNAISAQMLDNSGFLAGGLPVEYGFATGGTFDLRLRPGSKTRRKYQAQAGFIGFDLMAEGPIGSSGRTSYLVNGRYSFTGLLADMGVDFGGEEIRFADVNAHLHHEWVGGEVSAFAVVGGSSNVFRFAEDEEEVLDEQKELFDIDFESDLQVYGLSFINALGQGKLRAGLSFSGTATERNQAFRDGDQVLFQDLDYGLLNGNVSYLFPVGDGEATVGVEAIEQNGEYDNIVSNGIVGDVRIISEVEFNALSPFVGYRWKTSKSELNAGVRVSAYGGDVEDIVFEPRLSYNLRVGSIRLLAEADRVAQSPFSSLLREGGSVIDRFVPVANRATFGLGSNLGGANALVKVFYQYTAEDYATRQGDFLYSANNELEADPFILLGSRAATRRYGAEFELAGGRKTEGWYYRGNLTLLNAETEQIDGEWAKDRFAVDFIGKLTLGREWVGEDRKDRARVYGLNLALIAHGGERYGEIVGPMFPETRERFFLPQSFRNGFVNELDTYFRPDLRLYKTKTRPKTTTTLALDLQNVAGIENVGNVYYDAFLERPNERLQLGLIPVLSYRISWR